MPWQKNPTPQELYRARKAREDKERNALLPPGLVNHGNTCFMNSVLQGLIATRHLETLVQFRPIPSPLPQASGVLVASHRSPELTNGHGTGGEYELPWTTGLAIGDAFVELLLHAWRTRDVRERKCITPRAILSAIGQKYDQYLDFRQQDAHEFLRQLLDAMRMEEVDTIKKRSQSQSMYGQVDAQGLSPEAQDHASIPSQADSTPHTEDPPEPSISFVDMLFGGKLASILVCQACKHVSCTYEDYNDLSLSIKPEDYVRERKRDKLRQLARKLRHISGSALVVQRSSSVPATPARDSNLDSPDLSRSPRRRSIDVPNVEVAVAEEKQDAVESTNVVPESPNPPPLTSPAMESLDVPLPESSSGSVDQTVLGEAAKPGSKERKLKDDSWVKLSRRISTTMGLSKTTTTRSQQEELKAKNGDSSKVPEEELAYAANGPSAPVAASFPNSPRLSSERGSTLLNEILQSQFTIMKRSLNAAQKSSRPASAPRFPLITRPSSPSSRGKQHKPCPPKLRAWEATYLRDILADTGPHNIPRPFSFFKPSKEQTAAVPGALQSTLPKLSQLGRIEDCLRLFTSVEVLDGENMVRCHRCWKIENGIYDYAPKIHSCDSDTCTEDEDDEHHSPEPVAKPHSLESHIPDTTKPEAGFLAPAPPPSVPSVINPDTLQVDTSLAIADNSLLLSTTEPSPPTLVVDDCATFDDTPLPRQDPPIPLISMTGPESSPVIERPTVSRGSTMSSFVTHLSATSSKRSLVAPLDKHRDDRVSDSGAESDSASDRDTDAAYFYSDVSSAASPVNVSQERLEPALHSTRETSQRRKMKRLAVPRSEQVIMRAAYKRYLIASPPPILVIHLKRFQQMSKMPSSSFAFGFRKLDDYVSFPEYLDLAPFLAPKIEEYLDAKTRGAAGRGRRGRADPCLYRLYAVVVHIGNILGGHYVAYTALPTGGLDDGAQEEKAPSPPPPESAPRDWAYISDTVVRLASLEEVMKSKAYICMYERI